MSSNLHFYLVFIAIFTISINSIVISEKFHSLLSNHKIIDLTKQKPQTKDQNSFTSQQFFTGNQGSRILQNDFMDIPSNKPQSFDIQEKMTSKYLNLNLYPFQRSQAGLPSNFPDEKDIVYTSDIHIFSSLGIQAQSKKMAYIKSNIEGNRKMIFQHNYSKKKQYKLAENKFIILTAQEFKEMYLTLQKPQKSDNILSQEIQVKKPNKNIRSLQIQVNVTVNWKTAKKMTSVKFQQTCGACYSFTPIGAIQSAYMIFKNENLNLAEQQVVDCSAPYNNYGCIGGWNINSYKYIRDFGVVHESEYPYKSDFESCNVPEDSLKYQIKSCVEIPNDCSLVIDALKKQPLSIAVNSQGWIYYSSGVFTDCKDGGSNHGVILAGVDQTSWLIKNSWGFTWGQNGYMRLSRQAANNACNVCRWASYPVI